MPKIIGYRIDVAGAFDEKFVVVKVSADRMPENIGGPVNSIREAFELVEWDQQVDECLELLNTNPWNVKQA